MKLLKKLWKSLCRVLYSFFKHLPKSNAKFNIGQKRIRRFLAKQFIEYVGRDVNIEKNATFSSKTRIGDNSGIGVDCHLGEQVSIGCGVMMGPECVFLTTTHNHERTDIPMWQQGMADVKPIVIEDDVWIGTRVIILPGVTVGKGSIIGAGAVVTHDIEPYSIAVGVPARVIKKRL